MYHMVRDTEDPNEKRYCCSPNAFKRQISYLKKAGYRVLELDTLVNSIKKWAHYTGKNL